ncbi:4Fe-4S binding domain-containing protein [Desulfonatronum thiosulfatophilum]|uniref:4Fe-4S binding domain-containing protein n=1 Tax=Desulfonatronum thiosulfatophilum TaxID=617002 RepID=A0A1G6BWE0_9BACT|nr:mercury methylation ferredoxin HgcB [Desulfonatronum thiosulfatophilum]SDB24847.1 4Fe-4S binding domain-containing protein [Desulfonatronum thiosulfatophilum]
MKRYRHLQNVATLLYNEDKCVGCGLCATVCPHRIFVLCNGKAAVMDREACMECGACALNCPTEAITVTPGVGCASYIIQTWLPRKRSKGC